MAEPRARAQTADTEAALSLDLEGLWSPKKEADTGRDADTDDKNGKSHPQMAVFEACALPTLPAHSQFSWPEGATAMKVQGSDRYYVDAIDHKPQDRAKELLRVNQEIEFGAKSGQTITRARIGRICIVLRTAAKSKASSQSKGKGKSAAAPSSVECSVLAVTLPRTAGEQAHVHTMRSSKIAPVQPPALATDDEMRLIARVTGQYVFEHHVQGAAARAQRKRELERLANLLRPSLASTTCASTPARATRR